MNGQVILVQEEPRSASQLVEVPVNTAGLQRVQFPDVQQLRSLVNQRIIVKEIRLITADVLTNGPITGLAAAPVAELQKLSLVIYCEGWEKAQYLPVLVLNDMTVPGGTTPHRYSGTRFNDWQNVDWSKTFLQYSNGTLSAGAPYVLMFDVVYVKLDASGVEILGAS
jgi:hypothetical protein